MKPRTVVLTIEIQTPATLAEIRKMDTVHFDGPNDLVLSADIVQIQANVINPDAGQSIEVRR